MSAAGKWLALEYRSLVCHARSRMDYDSGLGEAWALDAVDIVCFV